MWCGSQELKWGSESSIEDPTNGVKFQLPDPLIVLASFGLDANFLTQNKGQCSYLQDHQNEYLDNVAQYAGGIMYSTDRVSLNVTCKERAIADNGSLDCGLPSWGGTTLANTAMAQSLPFHLQKSTPTCHQHLLMSAMKCPSCPSWHKCQMKPEPTSQQVWLSRMTCLLINMCASHIDKSLCHLYAHCPDLVHTNQVMQRLRLGSHAGQISRGSAGMHAP